ncbi:UNVERIFIED_CONTAM: molybdopterin-dependent oxidoreductase [Comamonas sp. A-3]|uniref:xanthine dehydrogenase family protein molybdopterin-binding subunit n=1 Tax=unclassified Comamonas TaxID=2638500 RepID=UPI0012CE7E9B|nr:MULTISPECIES: molybdopterin cofactor-binding domain-containing protein [Comamonas]MPT12907.1 xanthine dehydrogenase family protein molybdopterin-binding subunit [Comamonas sp.]UUC92715.1 molybdopterin-dependent oxidoreductase [Comamonas sp. C11]
MSSTQTQAVIEGPFVGRRQERLEDIALLTGRGSYGDDLAVKPGTLQAAILRSPHAHASLVSIDTSDAEVLPGVRAVLTGADVRRWTQPFVVGVKSPMEHWCLAQDRVRYVGEPIAVVVATDRYVAEDALELIRVQYEVLPVAADIESAVAEDAPVLHPAAGSNVVSDRNFAYGEPDVAFAAAEHRIGLTVHYPRNSCTPIEGAVVVAEHLAGDEGYDVCSNFMGPYSLHSVMAMALKIPGTRLRHRLPRDSGGSFGVKQSVFPYVVLMCLASRKAKAPVKWVEDRLEHLVAATSATGRKCTIEAAVDSQGRISALSYDQFDDVGGYLRAPEPATFYRMHGCLTGAYAIPNLKVRNRVVLTNRTPAGLVRGFGGPQVYFALERLMQRISLELGIDPLTLYQRNFVDPAAFPYRAAAGALLDSGNYPLALQMASEQGGLKELLERRNEARAEGRLYGIGFAAIVEPSISNMGYISTVMTAEQRAKAGPKNGAIASATVGIDPLGGVTVVIASAPAGQGHMTVCAQVVADVFGLKPEQITVNVDFDTQKDAWSVAAGNYSSRFAGAVAGTVYLAAVKLRDKVARIVAHQLACEASAVVFADGKVGDPTGQPRMLPFTRAASSGHWAPGQMPEGVAAGLRVTEFWTPEQLTPPDEKDRVNTSAAYGFAFDICAVEIDRATGRVRVDRYVTAHDAGKLLNPALADGQIRGAFAQGLGAALMEEFRYAGDGSFQSGTFADYLVPTTCEVPDPVIVHLETPSPFTPLGAKGLGEGNNMSTPVCVANAVADALAPTLGPCDLRLPLTPDKMMALIGFDDPPASGAAALASAARDIVSAPSGGSNSNGNQSGNGGKGKALSAVGVVQIAAPPQVVFDVLLNPDALAKVIPGCHSLQAISENRYRADVTVGVGMIKARYEAEIALSELDPPHSLRLAGVGNSSLGSARGSGKVLLEADGEGTRLHYDYSAEVSGKVAAVGGRMLEGAAKIVLGQLFEQLGRQASGQAVKTPSSGGWFKKLLAMLSMGGQS